MVAFPSKPYLLLAAVIASIAGFPTGSLSAQPSPSAHGTVALADLDLKLIDQDWSTAKRNRAVSGKPLRIAGETYAHGIGRFFVD